MARTQPALKWHAFVKFLMRKKTNIAQEEEKKANKKGKHKKEIRTLNKKNSL